MSGQTLNLSQCKEYLKNIKDLEISCYQQERLLQELRKQPSIAKNRITELENQLRAEKAPVEPTSVSSSIITNVVLNIFVPIIGAIVGIVIAIIVRILLAIFSSEIELFSSPWLPYIFWGAVIGYAVFFLLYLIIFTSNAKKDAVLEQKAYPEKMNLFREKQKELSEQIERKKKEIDIIIPQEITASVETYRQTKELLQKYYSMGFVYPKYRGLVPVFTLYEYLESGRCFSLLGHEGAYNLYENELRMNTIIGKLDDIIDRLDDISAGQRLLAQEIRRSNEQLNRISMTLDNIENNTALTQYYSSVTASNTTFMSWIAAFSYDEQKRARNS